MGTLRTEDESAGAFCAKVGSNSRDGTACLPREKHHSAPSATLELVRPAVSNPAIAAETPPGTTRKARPERPTILLVENEQPIREMLRIYLEGAGYCVLEAVDGDEALVLWERHADRVDLVLTDWMMPGHLNGCELVRQLHTSRPRLEAIIVSGQSSEAFEEEARLDGPNKFLPKPYRLKCLAAMVHGCLRHAEAA